ncbi:periplasmic solute binding family protein [Collimonas arenae]|uniref:Periplasmic solute binding family protein n=1 Tax=Collimonas arenae TaxID=279058 RepID=A0A127PUV8_9BURK|nr:metal ABC transporter substrate-binding protein [Collimonas arenae]AMP01162.1 periplasmic solute binding family protein [Collimonas arenae]AMP11056.1 periplasmic solute binding family protein [Collimonas arenae]
MKTVQKLTGLLLAALLLVSGSAVSAERIPVVASFSILADIVSNVGGERVAVSMLVGPDQDAHVFEPAPSDVKKIARAKLVVINGLGFEGWIERLANAAAYHGVIAVASDGIQPRQRPGHGNNAALRPDPHAWQDPVNVMTYTRNIVSALSRVDPAGSEIYKANGAKYLHQLAQLDDWAQAQFAQISGTQRTVITSHDAFEYFGAHYGVRFLAAQGVSTESEPSARDIAALIRQMKQQHVKALFFENMSNPQLLQQISNEVGVAPGGKLYADALSPPNGDAPTYLRMMRYNITQILARLRLN